MLRPYGLTYYQSLLGRSNVVAVRQVGENTEIDVHDLHSVSTGSYIFVSSGKIQGYHEVLSVSHVHSVTTITIAFPNADETQASGVVYAYDLYNYLIDPIIEKNINYIEGLTNLSLRGVQQYTEFHSGQGTAELMLDVKNIRELISIEILNRVPVHGILSISSVEIVPNMGILRIKRIAESYNLLMLNFPAGENNIKVTYEAGYEENEIPENIINALALLCIADILGNQASFDGGGTSISVEGYSQSFGAKGKYSEARVDLYRQAKVALKKYFSGVVGI
jgi:hypothetical protein